MCQEDIAAVYQEHKEMVWRLTSRYVSAKEDQEDLFQEIFLRIYKALPSFRGEAALRSWIYKITVNTAINYAKKRQISQKAKNVLSWLRIIETEENSVGPKEEGLITKALEKLNPKQRMILLLAEVEEKPLTEIASYLQIPVGTVKSNLNRAKENLKKELEKEDWTHD